MIQLAPLDYLVIFCYLLIIVMVSVLFRARRFKQMFGEEKKPSWLLLAASLLMIEWSPMTDMMSMGLVLENGYSSLWMLKSRFWLAGVPAILYATMWARLNFHTDNELIRLRYSGRSGRFLHAFRAVFLAVFVIPLFASFIILALRKLLDVLQLNIAIPPEGLLVAAVILLVFKNSFHQKIRTDFINAVICLTAPMLVCYYLLQQHGGWENVQHILLASAPEETKLIPSLHDRQHPSLFPDFLVFILIQWWSVNIVDNSDPNAQRHLQAKSQFAAFNALFFPILVTSFMFLFMSTIWDCGLLEYRASNHSDIDTEAFYLKITLQYLPDGIKALVLIALLFSFVTTLESIINWGGGLLTVDIIQAYIYKEGKDHHYRYLSLLSMLFVSCIGLLFAFNTDKILTLQKFVFSISAGVAPVYLLRWFWWRINAWTQISAMLGSLTYTLIYDYLYLHHPATRLLLDKAAEHTQLSAYPLKIVILTILVVCTWLTVMYCTKPDAANHLRKFVKETGTGGLWPKDFPQTGYRLGKRLWLCLVFAVTYILPFLFIWQFKFGNAGMGFILMAVFIVLAIVVHRSMAALLQAEEVHVHLEGTLKNEPRPGQGGVVDGIAVAKGK